MANVQLLIPLFIATHTVYQGEVRGRAFYLIVSFLFAAMRHLSVLRCQMKVNHRLVSRMLSLVRSEERLWRGVFGAGKKRISQDAP